MIYKILVAEDNFINQKLMEKILQSKGWGCKIVDNGKEVIKELKENKYDIVLMDISMPDLDGYSATQQIRVFNDQIPIIGISANVVSGFKEKCIENGMNDYLSKPFKKEDLFNIMSLYLPKE